ncbi:Gryzun, putative trafficking through golgi-domain-containing protein, partial [Gorgonomyces haynaldii]
QSVLSPLNTSSALYPDGIITQGYITRHTKQVPAVFVMVQDLWESVEQPKKDPLGLNQVSTLERDHDQITCAQITEARKPVVEKGSKFVVLLIVKNLKPEDPLLEERLMYIRRTCGMDRNTFFPYFALSGDKLAEPQTSLATRSQRLIFELACAHYREHDKRIKKKRAKVLTGPKAGQLSQLGWLIRYDFKLGFMYEMRQDYDAGIKSYESAYNGLLSLFKQNTEYAPETNRWYENLELLHFINFKLVQLHLLAEKPVHGLFYHLKHVHYLKDLVIFASTDNKSLTTGLEHLGLPPGNGSSAYWSFVTQHYRTFADLLDTVSTKKPGFKTPYPPNGSAASHLLSSQHFSLGDIHTSFGPHSATNALLTLLPAGYYYLTAARSAEERWKRSNDAVDHSAAVLELLTKAYEFFKKQKTSRMTLYMASEIARVYQQDGKHEIAYKFYERIGRSYRKEGWYSLLALISKRMAECSKQLGNTKQYLEALLEQIHIKTFISQENLNVLQSELAQISQQDISLDMSNLLSFLDVRVQFEKQQVHVSGSVLFQLSLISQSKIELPSGFRIQKAIVQFSNPVFDFVIQDQKSDLDFSISTNGSMHLNLKENQTSVYECSIQPMENQQLLVTTVTLCIEDIKLVYNIQEIKPSCGQWASNGKFQAIYPSFDPYTLRVEQREPLVAVKIQKPATVYLDEPLFLNMSAQNLESEPAHLVCHLQSFVNQDVDSNCFFVDTNTIHVDFGIVEPQQMVEKQVRCHFTKQGQRTLKGSCYLALSSSKIQIQKNGSLFDLTDTRLLGKQVLKELIQVDPVFELETRLERKIKPSLSYLTRAGAISDLDNNTVHKTDTWVLYCTIKLLSTDPIEISGLDFVPYPHADSEVSSIYVEKAYDNKDSIWQPGRVCTVSYLLHSRINLLNAIPVLDTGHLEIKWKRQIESITRLETKKMDLTQELLSITGYVPSGLQVGVPFTVQYIIQNLTLHVAELVTMVEFSDAFVFSGYKSSQFRLLPLSSHIVDLQCIPLTSGKAILPQLSVLKQSDAPQDDQPATKAAALEKRFPVRSNCSVNANGEMYVYVEPNADWLLN